MKALARVRLRRLLLALLALATCVAIGALVACNAGGFDPQSKVDSVRLFVVKADKPYAKPGETVTLEALLADGRKDRPRAAKLYWIPILCLNPRDDLYYLCFAPPGDGGREAGSTRLVPLGPLAALADGGLEGGGGSGTGTGTGTGTGNPFASIPTGVDLAPFLPQGPSFSFKMPEDALQPREGIAPYGLGIVFNILCAGRVEIAARDPEGGAQQVPIRCMDDEGKALPPRDYVIGISRVYSYAERTNTNPVIEKVTLDGLDVSPTAGVTIERCPEGTRERDCKDYKLDVRVSDSSWEPNPSDVTRDGPLNEQIWVAYYSDVGILENDARLLFDTRRGRAPDSAVKLRAPKQAQDGTLWMVVHDNRGGAAWIVVPLHVR